MTILAVVPDGDSFVLGADGQGQRGNPNLGLYEWYPLDKWEEITKENARVAWGFVGCKMGEEFGIRLKNHPLPSWQSLKEILRPHLLAINESLGHDDEQVVSLVIVGFIDGKPGMVALGPKGEDLEPTVRGALFVGRGDRVLAVPFWKQASWWPGTTVPRTLQPVLQLIVDRLTGLRGPVRMWRLTRDSFGEEP